MAALAERFALRRLGFALAGACLAAGVAGCSETVSRATDTSAPTARTDLVDPGQPIVLNSSSPAAGQPAGVATTTAPTTSTSAPAAAAAPAEPGVTAPDVQTAVTEPPPPPDPAVPREKPAVAATAIVEPSGNDIAGPQPSPEAVTTLSDDPVPLPDPGAAPPERLTDGPMPPANRDINQNEKAKLIGELKALAGRQGAGGTGDAAAAGGGNTADAAARAVLCDPAVDPECAVAE